MTKHSTSISIPLDCLDRYTRTELALDFLVANCLDVPEKLSKAAKERSQIAYLKEYCTVKLGCHRQAGHTTSAYNVATKYFDHPIFLSRGTEQAQMFHKFHGVPKRNCMSIGMCNNLRGYSDIDCLVVDLVSMISNSQLDELYQVATGLHDLRCIILLQ